MVEQSKSNIDWSKFTESQKMAKVAPDSRKLGLFLDWLQEQGIHLSRMEETHCNYGDPEDLVDIHESKERLLARYFNIDLDKVDAERTELLKEIREGAKNG